VLTVPAAIAANIPSVADRLQRAEQTIIDFCRSKDFSVPKLREVMKTLGYETPREGQSKETQ
jgi:hypothetical protein